MSPERSTSTLTLTVLAVLLLIGVAWGWQAATEPFPGEEEEEPSAAEEICHYREYPQGKKLFAKHFVVSVYNGGTRAGLAERTMEQLVRGQNFGEGELGNAPREEGDIVLHAQVWTSEPDRPGPQLVATRLAKGGAPIVEREGLGPGVTVVVGDRFREPRGGKINITNPRELTVCSPPPLSQRTNDDDR